MTELQPYDLRSFRLHTSQRELCWALSWRARADELQFRWKNRGCLLMCTVSASGQLSLASMRISFGCTASAARARPLAVLGPPQHPAMLALRAELLAEPAVRAKEMRAWLCENAAQRAHVMQSLRLWRKQMRGVVPQALHTLGKPSSRHRI